MIINKILVVDESATDRMTLKNILLEAGYEVIEASSGQEAVEKAIAEKPGLIFLDADTQKMEDFQSYKKMIRGEETKYIPIQFVIGEMRKVDRMWAEGLGGSKGLIQKPYTPDQVLEQINQFK